MRSSLRNSGGQTSMVERISARSPFPNSAVFFSMTACSIQVRTKTLGPSVYPVQDEVVEKNAQLLGNADRAELRSTQLVWPPLLRKLDRIDPSYKT